MTREEISETKAFQRYGTKVSDDSEAVLDLLNEQNLLQVTPFREIAATLCCTNLALLSKTPTKTSKEEILRGFRAAADTLSGWIGVERSEELHNEVFSSMVNVVLNKLLEDERGKGDMIELLTKSTCVAAAGAGFEFYKTELQLITEKHVDGMINVIEGVNEILVKVLEERGNLKWNG